MIEISVIHHPLGGNRAESIATATINDDGRVTASSGTVRTQTLVERVVVDPVHIWHQIAEIAQAVAGAQQTTTTREQPQAPAVRRPGVMEMRACFPGTRVPIYLMQLYLTSDDAVAEFLKDYPSVKRLQVVRAVKRAFELLERDAPLDIRDDP